jgi:magnesium chelatase family protein
MNPCRCGGGPGAAACTRGPRCAQDYQARISGPFLDRIDLFYETPPVTAVDLSLPAPSEGSAEVRDRVARARELQAERFESGPEGRRLINADMPPGAIDQFALPDAPGAALLADAAAKLSLTARGYTRVLKVARTIADLDGSDGVRRVHIAEALSYRHRPASSTASVGSSAIAR